MARGARATIRLRHAPSIARVAWSPSGEAVYSVGLDGRLCRWNARTGELEHAVKVCPNDARVLVVSRDGIVGAGMKTITLFAGDSCKKVGALEASKEPLWRAAMSPCGQWIAGCSGDGWIDRWEVQSGVKKTFRCAASDRITAVAFSPDGQRLASSSSSGLFQMWTIGGKRLHSRRGPADDLEYHFTFEFSADGRYVYTQGQYDAEIFRHDATSWEVVDSLRLGEELTLRHSHATPDGTRHVVVGGRRSGGPTSALVEVFDWERKARVRVIDTAHAEFLDDSAVSPDGTRLVVAGGPTMSLWELADGRCLLRGDEGAPEA